MTTKHDKDEAPRDANPQWLEPTTPDPALFDPMQETDWTLAMAVVWLRWGSADTVREQWNIWRGQCLDWQRHGDHDNLVRVRQASLEVLIEDAPENRKAWTTLLDALQDGQITATGVRANSNEGAVPIPAAEWRRLVNHPTGPDLVEKFRYSYTSTSPGHGYDEILLERADVLHLWSGGAAQATATEYGPPPAREKETPGPKPQHSAVAIQKLARQVIKNGPKVAGVRPAKERLYDKIMELHHKAWPDEPVPQRSTIQRALKGVDLAALPDDEAER